MSREASLATFLAAQQVAAFQGEVHAVTIPTPAELALEHRTRHAAEAAKVEVEIARRLRAVEAPSWPQRFYIDVRATIREAVRQSFSARGWDVTYHSEQREGQWVEIRPLREVT